MGLHRQQGTVFEEPGDDTVLFSGGNLGADAPKQLLFEPDIRLDPIDELVESMLEMLRAVIGPPEPDQYLFEISFTGTQFFDDLVTTCGERGAVVPFDIGTKVRAYGGPQEPLLSRFARHHRPTQMLNRTVAAGKFLRGQHALRMRHRRDRRQQCARLALPQREHVDKRRTGVAHGDR